MLDVGTTRVARTPYERPRGMREDEQEVTSRDGADTFECFLAQQMRESELRNADIKEHEWDQVLKWETKGVWQTHQDGG